MGGIRKFDGENWSGYDQEAIGLNIGYIDCIVVDEFNNKWLGAGNGLYVINEDGVVSVEDDLQQSELTPTNFILYQNYPNPFNPTTTIRYEIPNMADVRTGVDPKISPSNRLQSGRHMSLPQIHVKLCIYDILGREITTLVNENQKPGYYEVNFNAANLPSGVYFYRLQIGTDQGFVETKKMLLLR